MNREKTLKDYVGCYVESIGVRPTMGACFRKLYAGTLYVSTFCSRVSAFPFSKTQ